MKKNNGLWEYLDQTGVLEWGTEEQIVKAKKEYRKLYLLQFKRVQRSKRKEVVISLNKSNGEFSKVRKASAHHNKSLPDFIKSAVNAYLDQKYLVPNPYRVAKLEQMLSQILNKIQIIVEDHSGFYGNKNIAIGIIENRIQQLENEIDRAFRKPELVTTSYDCQSKIA